MKSKCCGADIIHDEHFSCKGCTQPCIPVLEKEDFWLTPEQIKAIRWPSYEECNRQDNHQLTIHHLIDWAIRYALQDLMPEEENETTDG